MISGAAFVEALVQNGIAVVSGVPCSFFASAISQCVADRRISYISAANEGTALALAAGSQVAGKPAALLIQNSGLGNLINPLTSLSMIYKIPTLLFVSGRGVGIPDEPQHEIMGKKTESILDTLEIQHEMLHDEPSLCLKSIARAVRAMHQSHLPYAFLVKKGTIGDEEIGGCPSSPYPLSRAEAIKSIASSLSGDEYIVSTTGKPSRELFANHDSPHNFYMQGSLGHASAFAFGIAREKPSKKIIILDGDGSLLMHMGSLSTIGHYRPSNLYHIILDNEVYESTGGQESTSSTTDIGAVASACGYVSCVTVSTREKLERHVRLLNNSQGPTLLRVKINCEQFAGSLPRISSAYTPEEITKRFRHSLKEG